MHIVIDFGDGHDLHPLASTAETIFDFAASRIDRTMASPRLVEKLSPRERTDMRATTYWDLCDLMTADYSILDDLMEDLDANKGVALANWNREWIPVFEKQFAMFRAVLKQKIAQSSTS